jgi:hypothetical protein
MIDLRQLVLQACANSAENGYQLDDSDEQEAIEILDQDSDIAELCLKTFGDDTDAGIEAVAGHVAEYRAGART